MPRAATARLSAALIALAFAGNATADSRSDLHAAFLKNLAAKSYRSTITDIASGAQVSTVEYQAPDRYRIQATGAPASVIAGGAMYMDVNGKAMKMPLPPGMLDKFRSDSAWKRMEKDTLIREVGPTLVGKEAARKYHWITGGKNASTGDVWVSTKTGYVVQVETAKEPGSRMGAVRVSYGSFNDPAIRIAPPR